MQDGPSLGLSLGPTPAFRPSMPNVSNARHALCPFSMLKADIALCPVTVHCCGTYCFLSILMDKEPLANLTTINITHSNVNIEHDQ